MKLLEYQYSRKKYFFYFLGFVWQKLIFLCNKTIKTSLKGCLSHTPLNQKSI
jgi:hypothetical protein